MAAPTITLRVPKETEDALVALSEATGRAVGDLVREGIDRLLADIDEDAVVAQLAEARQRKDAALRKATHAANEAKKARERAKQAAGRKTG